MAVQRSRRKIDGRGKAVSVDAAKRWTEETQGQKRGTDGWKISKLQSKPLSTIPVLLRTPCNITHLAKMGNPPDSQ